VVRILHILSLFAIAATCGILGFWLNGRDRSDPRLEAIQTTEIRGQRSEVGDQKSEVNGESVPPLVAAAQAFAAILNPPAPVKPAETSVASPDPPPLFAPRAKPVEAAISFKVVATSYYAGRPDKSMALLAEPGNKDGGRWVKEGAQIGHFTVHEIKQGVVVLREGDNVRELAVERTTIERSLVKEVRPATRQFSAAVHDGNEIASTPKVSAEDGSDFTVEGDWAERGSADGSHTQR
jgi:hypothetical protein